MYTLIQDVRKGPNQTWHSYAYRSNYNYTVSLLTAVAAEG